MTQIKNGDIVRRQLPSGTLVGPYIMVTHAKKKSIQGILMMSNGLHENRKVELDGDSVVKMKICTIRVNENTIEHINIAEVIYHSPDKFWDKLFDGPYDILRISSPKTGIVHYITYHSAQRVCKKKTNPYARRKVDRLKVEYVPFIKVTIDQIICTTDENA